MTDSPNSPKSDGAGAAVNRPPVTPVMIFDGDCGFCRFWIERWRTWTKGRVEFVPYQDATVKERFPEVPVAQCEQAVQLVERDGRVFSGAAAVFQSLAGVFVLGWFIRAYRRSSGFANVTEVAYRLVATRRIFFSQLNRWLWGTNPELPRYELTFTLLVRALGLIFLVGFISLWVQIHGLVGANGILPAGDYMRAAEANFDQQGTSPGRYFALPTPGGFAAGDAALHACCLLGLLASVLAVLGLFPAAALAVCWLLHLMLVVLGQVFLSFQWDGLLLEAGCLALLKAPWSRWLRHSFEQPRWLHPRAMNTRPLGLILALVWAPGCLVRLQGAAVPTVDPTTLAGKVMCGYQGWFNCEGDGAERGWFHWTKRGGPLASGNAKVDLWPDVSELGPDERFPTGFTNAAGQVAEVFSSFKEPTVLRHFQWMRDYGIDGAFVQRFIVDVQSPTGRRHNDAVLAHCRKGAEQSGRTFVVMYDLSGLGSNRIAQVREDWQRLRHALRVTEDAAYLRHRGKPLVAVWGVGFSDGRRYTLAECRELVEFLKRDGCTVMVGVPTYWRELKNDALNDPRLHEIIRLADVVSPWTVGRYKSPAEVGRHAEQVLKPDLVWCAAAKVDYLPVVFPGFSWHNMHGGALDFIPRRKGEFLWSQFTAVRRAGAQSVYVAMFDEVDEGTAIFKCTNDVPVDDVSKFVTYEGLPSDFYLRLTGAGGRLMRGELPVSEEVPVPR